MTGPSSPSLSGSSPVIQRSRRTYSRPKPQPTSNPDTPIYKAGHNTLSSISSKELSLSNTDDELPPNSDDIDASTSFGTHVEDEENDESPFQFDWQKTLIAMDQDDADFLHVQLGMNVSEDNPLPDDLERTALSSTRATTTDTPAICLDTASPESHENRALRSQLTVAHDEEFSTRGKMKQRENLAQTSPETTTASAPTSPMSSSPSPRSFFRKVSKGKGRADLRLSSDEDDVPPHTRRSSYRAAKAKTSRKVCFLMSERFVKYVLKQSLVSIQERNRRGKEEYRSYDCEPNY